MSFLSWPWERNEKPFFTNKEGFDWWVNETLTEACERDSFRGPGVPLPNTKVFLVSKDNEPVTYAIVSGNELVYENTSFEAVCYKIDMLRMIEAVRNEEDA